MLQGRRVVLPKSPALTELRIIKSSKTSLICVLLCNMRIIVALETHPNQVSLC